VTGKESEDVFETGGIRRTLNGLTLCFLMSEFALSNMDVNIDHSIGNWFKIYRESYKWPSCTRQEESEKRILKLKSSVSSAINENSIDKLSASLKGIIQWKANRMTSRYNITLDSLGEEYLHNIIGLGPFNNTENLDALIRTLHIKNCNLPECTAIASFLFNRNDVPIFDKYISLFFAREFKIEQSDEETIQVLRFVKHIKFKNESAGKDKTGHKIRRPDVYHKSGFEINYCKYLDEFIPECKRISDYLNRSNIQYCDIQDKMVQFCPVDIEMAIFSYATQHKDFF